MALKQHYQRFLMIKNKSDYVALNYDEITKGFTPSFIHQLECSIHPDHVWWKREKIPILLNMMQDVQLT